MTLHKIANRILSVRTRVPDEQGHQPNRWTETPLRNSDDVAQIIIDLLPYRMVEEIWDRLDHHLADTAAAFEYTGDDIHPPHASMILVPLWLVAAVMTIGIFAKAFPRR